MSVRSTSQAVLVDPNFAEIFLEVIVVKSVLMVLNYPILDAQASQFKEKHYDV